MINLIVVASIAILALLAFYKGSRIMLTAIISFYPSSMLYMALPIKDSLLFLGKTGNQLFYSHAAIYGVLFLLVFFAAYRVTGHEHLGYGNSKWINSILIGGSFVLAVLALSFHVLPAYNVFQLNNASLRNFWISDWGYFAAIVAPIVAISRIARGGGSSRKSNITF